MPGRVDNGTKSSRFELPALDLNFGSITDGTNIPPPPKSPVDKPTEKPSMTVSPATPVPKVLDPTTVAALEGKLAAEQGRVNGNNSAGTKRPADDIPPSPTVSSTRSGSLRRLLSRSLLNNSYAEGPQPNGNGPAAAAAPSVAAPSIYGGSRPPSRTGASSVLDDRKAKRGSGWFRRLRGGDQKRSSLFFEQSSTDTTHAPSGLPPPMIPELKELEKDDGSLGSDLFKNIK
jgi:hypothetical protein